MNKIGLMGGTFDPVHYGHIELAVSAKEELDLDRVIMIPAYIQPFKRDRYITPDEQRLNMLELSISREDGLEISTWEIDKGGISYTYDTLTYFRSLYTDSEITFIMGSDSLLKIEGWYKGIDLLKSCSFAVGTRPSDDDQIIIDTIANLHHKYGTKIYKVKNKMLPINSTMIREKIEREEPISGLVVPEVENYIYENKLYM